VNSLIPLIRNRAILGSADWMPRNFARRIEIAFPVLAPHLQAKIKVFWSFSLLGKRLLAWT
jgi:polyphosphate kinase